MMGSVVVDSNICPCLCVDSLSLSNVSFRSSGHLGSYRRQSRRSSATMELRSSFVDAWHEWRLSSKALSGVVRRQSRRQRKIRDRVIVDELGGQYEEGFDDVTAVSELLCFVSVLSLIH